MQDKIGVRLWRRMSCWKRRSGGPRVSVKCQILCWRGEPRRERRGGVEQRCSPALRWNGLAQLCCWCWWDESRGLAVSSGVTCSTKGNMNMRPNNFWFPRLSPQHLLSITVSAPKNLAGLLIPPVGLKCPRELVLPSIVQYGSVVPQESFFTVRGDAKWRWPAYARQDGWLQTNTESWNRRKNFRLQRLKVSRYPSYYA